MSGPRFTSEDIVVRAICAECHESWLQVSDAEDVTCSCGGDEIRVMPTEQPRRPANEDEDRA